jgi:DUF4097 and DUF4098 domain-containing protein YvlB
MLEPLAENSFPADTIQSIHVDIDSGTLNIRQNESSSIRFSGMAPVGQVPIPIQDDDHGNLSISILPESSMESIYVLEIPAGKKIFIQSNQADINLAAYQGKIDIDSISGSITAKELSGFVTLRSGRGNITLKDSTGEMHILGEHGLLNINNLHGVLTSSTIMGTIQYFGSPSEGDQINLEVDHGPISVKLGNSSSLQYAVQSASGEVNCLIPRTELLPRGCQGTYGQGGAELKIRSVSGKINLTVTQ